MIDWVLAEVNVHIAPQHEERLIAAYHRLIAQPLPEGLLQTELLRGRDGQWRIQTLWRDRLALDVMRESAEGPTAPQLFRELDAEPDFAIFDVVDERFVAEPDSPQ